MSTSAVNRALMAFNEGRREDARRALTEHLKTAPGDVEALYLLGVTEQARNHAYESLALYDQVLARAPGHLGAHYNKALLLSNLGRHTEAMAHHDAATRLAPDNFWAFLNRGNSRVALKQPQAAIADFDCALTLKPDLFEALTGKGNALLEMGLHAEALECHDEALKLAPSSAVAWINTGRTLFELNRFDDAKRCAEQALKLSSDNADAWCLHGIALNEMQLREQAISCFQRATAIKPDHAEAWSNQGVALSALQRYDEALTCHQRAIDIKADDFRAWVNLGAVLHDLERHSEAMRCFEHAIRINPNYSDAYSNLGSTFVELGRNDEAQRCYERAIQLQPDNPSANWNLAQLLISRSAYTEGWDRFEYRWEFRKLNLKRLQTTKPRWSGAPSIHPLLLWGEQGIGDQILYGSVLPTLATLPQRKLVALDKRLMALFARSMPGFEFIDLAQASDVLDFAEQLPLGSLPSHFRRSRESFAAARHPFLFADPARVADLRQKIARPGKMVCGVSWSSTRKRIGAHKSISLAEMLMPLAGNALHFVNLQYGDTAAERQALQAQHGIAVQSVDEIDNFNDIDGLAALIDACDLVLTTSNTTAHLAGALGKETLLLLPLGKGRLWYWSDHDGQNPWYPTIHSFVQALPGDWSQPLATIKNRLYC